MEEYDLEEWGSGLNQRSEGERGLAAWVVQGACNSEIVAQSAYVAKR
jgi:hypothetical protein